MIATRRGGWRELSLVLLGFGALTIALTYPLAFHLGSMARVDNGDGQFSIWNIAWVARALVRDPLHVLDANIFYPHRGTLLYSESNLGAGALAVPVYWTTRNAYAAHNVVLLLSFVLAAGGMYYLVRYLVDDRRAAVISAICFAYCPYAFAHTPHIQLMFTAGLPFSALAFHRLADRPGIGRGVALGVAMAAQAYFCGYYAIFVTLTIGLAAAIVATTRRLWTNTNYWTAIGAAALAAVVLALPIALPYASQHRVTGFARSLANARSFSAEWPAYFQSGAYAHAWMARVVGLWKGEALFPGFVALVVGVAGAAIGWRARGRLREIVVLYAGVGILACWASFGPPAGLYTALYWSAPGFSFLRAAGRFGLIFDFALAVLAGIGAASLLARASRPRFAVSALAVLTIAELAVPIHFPPVPPDDPGYHVLATLPYGPVLELPVYSPKFAFAREQYMLSSTIHWMPLIDAYSDYIPEDFVEHADALGDFPSRDAFNVLGPIHGRYAVIHVDTYSPVARAELMTRLQEFAPYLRRHYAGERMWLYEIVGFPRFTAAR